MRRGNIRLDKELLRRHAVVPVIVPVSKPLTRAASGRGPKLITCSDSIGSVLTRCPLTFRGC